MVLKVIGLTLNLTLLTEPQYGTHSLWVSAETIRLSMYITNYKIISRSVDIS